jgi:hypothetical protein
VLERGLGFGHVRNLFTQTGNPTLLHSLARSLTCPQKQRERTLARKKSRGRGKELGAGGGLESEKGRGSVCVCFCLQDVGFRMQDGGSKNDETFVHQKQDWR